MICALVNATAFGMDNITQDRWWGYKLKGSISQSAIESNSGVVRIQLEGINNLGGEIRAPQVYLFCNRQYESELPNFIIFKTKELFINDRLIANLSQDFEIGSKKLYALINSVELEEFRKRPLFEPKFTFTKEMDLFEDTYEIIKFVKKHRKKLVQERTMLSANKALHTWKLPKTIDILAFGYPYVVYAVSFGENGGRFRSDQSKQPADQILDEEEKIFDLDLKAFEKDMFLTKTEPKDNRLQLDTSLRGFNGPKESPRLSIDCQRCFEHTYLNLHVKSH